MAWIRVIPLLLLPILCQSQEVTLSYELKEEQEEGTFVGNVARDSFLYGNVTEDVFQRLKFNFFSQGNPFSRLFRIDEKSSTIRTSQVINREATDVCEDQVKCVLNLDIAVYIRDVSRNRYDLYKLMQAKVNLQDINDNAPEFPTKSISLSLPESVPVNYMMLASGAVDKDMGPNNTIKSYEISPPNGMFGLRVKHDFGTSDLGIVVKHRLDRETKDFFQVNLIAKDGGYPQRTGSVLINITVTDVNDNRPAFIESTFNVTVPENRPPNATILLLSAIDQDKDANGQIGYHFSSRVSAKTRRILGIDSATGRIYTKGVIDYEHNKQFQFMVEARDHGSPAQSSLASVIINVDDANDNAPEININLSPEGTDISEGVKTGKFIAHVSVSDADSGKNGLVKCDMNDAHFALERFYKDMPNIYKITLKEQLDHESSSSHNVTITCTDGGDHPLMNSTSFLVVVLDENDNAPSFSSSSFTGSILENNDIGEEILQITAHDWDSGNNGRITFSLASDAGSLFTVVPHSGVVVANAPFDREAIREYRFGVIATDHGTPPKSSSAEVIVSILDQNDQPPKFTRPVFLGYVLENQPLDTPVLNLTATDDDEIPQMKFQISPGSDAHRWFALDGRSGKLTTKIKFDREVRKKFNFTVIVSDPRILSFQDTAYVTVVVLDDNDHVPVITYPTQTNNTVRVVYGIKAGTVFTRISAKDTDDADIPFRRLTYSILRGNTRSLFNVNRMNGDLAVSRMMTPDDIISYELTVGVHDSGRNSRSSTATLNVIIVDVNGTITRQGEDHKLDQNMMIVIILIAVTVILAIAIFATICMIRRIDRERQQRRVAMVKTAEDKVLASMVNHDTYLVIAKDSNENDDAKFKRNRKEVSFTFEDDKDVHNMSNSSGVASMSTFGVPLPVDNSHSKCREANIPMHPMPPLVEVKQNDMNSPSAREPVAIPVQNNIPPAPHPADKIWIQNINESEARHLMEILKKPDDIMSETSGETGTSDSGRGGSDEDINSNRSATHDIDESHILSPAHFLAADALNRFKDGRLSDLSRMPPRRCGPRRDVVSPGPGKHAVEDLRGYNRSHDLPRGYTASPCHFEQFPSNSSYKNSSLPNNSAYHRMDLLPCSSKQTDFSFNGFWQTRDDSLSCRDDDDRTTTSGSYIISPEELRHDIDDVFYTEKDIVV